VEGVKPWIIIVAAVVLGLIYLGLAARPLLKRLKALKAQQAGLQKAASKAQELAQVAQGLQAHADSLQIRTELLQERIEAIKNTRAAMKAD
jgi:flagellar biosynthesis/type III secretory pathway M-ring protein FliF/YscJ